MNLGHRIKDLRIKNNLTQVELAEKLGVKKSTISGYENNMRKPNYEVIAKLVEALDVTFNDLLGDVRDTYYTEELKQLLSEEEKKIFDIGNLDYIQLAHEMAKNEIPIEDVKAALAIVQSARKNAKKGR